MRKQPTPSIVEVKAGRPKHTTRKNFKLKKFYNVSNVANYSQIWEPGSIRSDCYQEQRAQTLWNCSRLETLLTITWFLAQHYGLSPSLQPTASWVRSPLPLEQRIRVQNQATELHCRKGGAIRATISAPRAFPNQHPQLHVRNTSPPVTTSGSPSSEPGARIPNTALEAETGSLQKRRFIRTNS